MYLFPMTALKALLLVFLMNQKYYLIIKKMIENMR